MSYSRNYSETVSKVVSRTVSYRYPASQSGGSDSVYVEIRADIPVNVIINVDTDPFDTSIHHCDTNIDLLTASVVATEAAEIISKEKNSKKVADTIIGGFFSYIRSEISQQIAELSQNIDAQLMHLKELSVSCLAKKKQMEDDYLRTSGRYIKIFKDLNNELSNRIFNLDQPTFTFKKETDNLKIRASANDLVSTVAIIGKESSDLQSTISASMAKNRALETLNKAKIFLWQQKKLDNTIQQSMLNESVSSLIFEPVCFIESTNSGHQIDQNIFSSNYFPVLNEVTQKKILMEQFSSNGIRWGEIAEDELKMINLYFNTELNSEKVSNDQHAVRVREMIQTVAKINSINTINFQQI